MKTQFWISLLLLAVGFLGAAANILTGLGLSQEENSGATQHLSTALISVFCLIAGGFLSIYASKKILFLANQRVLLSSQNEESTPHLLMLTAIRQRALYFSLLVIVFSLTNLITGTFSHAGQFPLVHAILGFALAALSLISLILWFNFLEKDRKA